MTITQEVLDALEVLGETCFLCRLCREDLRRNGCLTDGYPAQGPLYMDHLFPAEAKRWHLRLEGLA